MALSVKTEGRVMTVFLEGEIDHCSSKGIRDCIEKELSKRKIEELIFDFSKVGFMDSSGVGMLIGRYRSVSAQGGYVRAKGLNTQMEKLFRLAGLHRIISVNAEMEDTPNE